MAQAQALTVCIAGATGWTGRALVPAVMDAPDLVLGSAVSRSAAGRDLGEALGGEALGVPVHASVPEALEGVDVLVDYTSATAVKANALAAIDAGVAVVIGSSGLTALDFEEIDAPARARGVGVVAAGNFSLTAAMMQAAALLAAPHLPHREIIDYALLRLRTKLEYSRIAHEFLGETFTMAELRGVHEAVLRKRVDPANFRRTIEASGTLVDTGERLAGTPHRPPALYRFDTSADPVTPDRILPLSRMSS